MRGVHRHGVGDLLQIKPVKADYVFLEPNNVNFKYYHQVNSLWHKFKAHTLEHNHRQGEGGAWANTLNRIRKGTHTEADMDILKERCTSNKFCIQDAEHVMYTRMEVQTHNVAMMNTLKSNEIEPKRQDC